MKRNLLSVLILALLIVNVALTAVMMISVMQTNKKTAALIDSISMVLNLEIEKAQEEGPVPISDLDVYQIPDEMTILLKADDSGMSHYAMVSVSIVMNSKDEDYATYQPMVSQRESLIKSEIMEAFGSYTKAEVEADSSIVANDIKQRLQTMFDSKFITDVSFQKIVTQ
ncbi:MAG: flagellar basal body-associated FliL family protein [Lachnospiraceae bacterium]|nr:flagellar basal body-associated FliL family protein [Lachnospiraceae bacterium]